VTAGERHRADLVNQASAQSDFNKRMFRYFARLYEEHGAPIYPVVIFSFDKPRRAEPNRLEVVFPGLPVLDFRYHVIQLNRLSWRDYARLPNPVASALMSKMRIAPEERPHVKLQCLRLLATLKLDPARMQLISGFVDTYLDLNASEEREFQVELEKEFPPQREEVMQIVTSWMREGIEQGLEQGIEQGLEQGRQEEAAALIWRQLNRRVGALPETLEGRVRRLSLDKLELLGEALLDFAARADLDKWLAEHD
jgi:hypothetical protein